MKNIYFTLFLISISVTPLFPQYTADFEDGSKTSYVVANETYNGISWTVQQANIGFSPGFDLFNGTKALRIRYRASGNQGLVEMNSDIADGIDTISFVYAQYVGDPNPPTIVVEYSVNGGSSWIQAGSDISSSGVNTLTSWSHTINTTVPTRIRFRAISGNDFRRMNIDDLVLSSSTLGNSEESNENDDLRIFPNLTSDFIMVDNLKGNQRYYIFNSIGQKIIEQTIRQNEKIDVQYLDDGLYFLKFEEGNSFKFTKV